MKPFIINKLGVDISIGPVICIESIHPHFVRDLVNSGVNILAIITNDSWYDNTSGPYQHYMIAAARAIESRRFVVRCANSGISGFITPTGKTLSIAPQYSRAVLSANVPLLDANDITFYHLVGDLFPYLMMLLVVVLVVISILNKKRKANIK